MQFVFAVLDFPQVLLCQYTPYFPLWVCFNLTCMRFAVQSVLWLVGCVLHIIYNVHMTGPFFCYSPILFTPVLVGWSLGGKS